MTSELSTAMKEGRSKAILGSIPDRLIEYAHSHFTTEEQLFAKYHYPNTAEHKSKQDDFVVKIGEFNDGLQKNSRVLSIQMIQFLSEWLLDHIKVEDLKYATFLAEIQAPCVLAQV